MSLRLPDQQNIGAPFSPSPQPPGRLARIDTSQIDTPIAEGVSVAHAGAAILEGATHLAVAESHYDTLRAEDKYNDYRNKQLDLTYGDGGFASKKGGDALAP